MRSVSFFRSNTLRTRWVPLAPISVCSRFALAHNIDEEIKRDCSQSSSPHNCDDYVLNVDCPFSNKDFADAAIVTALTRYYYSSVVFSIHNVNAKNFSHAFGTKIAPKCDLNQFLTWYQFPWWPSRVVFPSTT